MDRVQAILERGRQARAVLESATVTEAFDYITERLQKEWRNTTAPMATHRESLFHQIAALDAVQRQMKRWAEDAAFEQQKIDKANAKRR